MKFTLDDKEKVIVFWLLNSEDKVIKALCKTLKKQNKKNSNSRAEFEAKVTVNGVELDFTDLDAWLMKAYERTIQEAEAKYTDIDRAVQKRAEEILEKQAKGVREKLFDFECSLEEIGSMIKPFWEK